MSDDITINHKITDKIIYHGPKNNLNGADLRDANLRNADLSDTNLKNADLRGANLRNAYLMDADLSYAKLIDANLRDANLRNANLREANLRGADFRSTNLDGAGLRGANLDSADLRCAYLSYANLSYANLSYANFSNANLRSANLREANLRGADLRGADLRNANLIDAINAKLVYAKTRILPDGNIIGWKKCRNNTLVKLLVPQDARRSHAFGRKCRAEYVDVLEIIGNSKAASSTYDIATVYRVGERVTCDIWCEDWQQECAGGIHFFITREEAEAYT